MDAIKRLRALREAGAVKRCHTVPIIGSYDIAQHSFGAVNLLLVLRPRSRLELVKVLLWHDCAERWVGDIPAPAKWIVPELGKLYELLERRVLAAIGCSAEQLTADEARWVDWIDKLELWLWTYDQVALGNRNALSIRRNLRRYFRRQRRLPRAIQSIIDNYKWRRENDTIPGF